MNNLLDNNRSNSNYDLSYRRKFLMEFIVEILKEVRRRLPKQEVKEISEQISEKSILKKTSNLFQEHPKLSVQANSSKEIQKNLESFSYEPLAQNNSNQTDFISLGELRKYIMDPNIQVIECQGPNKPLIIRHNGVIQPVHHSLDESQINSILSEFSQRTLIPLIPGVFKAALGNILITAIISEYVGNRFVIQKIQPNQSLVFNP